jgi:hypothetical protein
MAILISTPSKKQHVIHEHTINNKRRVKETTHKKTPPKMKPLKSQFLKVSGTTTHPSSPQKTISPSRFPADMD